MSVDDLPAGTALIFFQGTLEVTPQPFGGGLRRVGGNVIRLGVKMASDTSSSFPQAGDPFLVQAAHVSTSYGGVRTYLVWYRGPAGYCNGSDLSFSNGLRMSWSH